MNQGQIRDGSPHAESATVPARRYGRCAALAAMVVVPGSARVNGSKRCGIYPVREPWKRKWRTLRERSALITALEACWGTTLDRSA